jgi:hypothetical protein
MFIKNAQDVLVVSGETVLLFSSVLSSYFFRHFLWINKVWGDDINMLFFFCMNQIN